MKKFIKWFSIVLAGLLVLAVAFTAAFIVIPLSRSIKNIQEKRDEPASSVTQTAETAADTTAPPETQPAAPETTAAARQESVFTDYDIYRSGHFYVTGTVTDSDGVTNPMELAITEDSVYMLTAASGVQMGVMVGGGKTYLVSPAHRAYIELNKTVMSVMGLDADKLSAASSFNFSDMLPLSEADAVNETELNGVKCTEYVFTTSSGKKTMIYLDGARLLQTDMYNEDGSFYNRMTFDSVSAEVPADRLAPPTYYDKKGMLGFITLVSKDING
ncbi:MAG: hypothetical protein IJK89_09040 [Clostridia bacterium]|nr:hypothetical protein [Clostridia bacterium]